MKRHTRIFKAVFNPVRFGTLHTYYWLRRKGKRTHPGEERPLYSVIVASYNYANLIGETLDSLLAQTYGNYEIIVVDDGSTDNSMAVVQRYCEKYSQIKLYTHEDHKNHGLCETLKLALTKAQGDYIAFCESDDRWDENHLETITQFINSYKNVVFVHNRVIFTGSPQCHQKTVVHISSIQKHYFHTGYNRININKHATYNRIATFSSVVIKADVLRPLDFNSPVPSHLDLWLYRQIFAKYPMHYCDTAVTYWRMHADSYCSKDLKERQEQLRDALEELVAKSNELIQASQA